MRISDWSSDVCASDLQANRQLILQRESTVRFLRNGSLYREVRLQPGRYDFSSLPLIAGSNDVDIQVTDNSGAVQNLSYQQYLDPIDLDPGAIGRASCRERGCQYV